MAFKLMMSAQSKWRKLDGQNRFSQIIGGVARLRKGQGAERDEGLCDHPGSDNYLWDRRVAQGFMLGVSALTHSRASKLVESQTDSYQKQQSNDENHEPG